MTDPAGPEELADRVAELETRLDELQDELKREQRRRGPSIPTPGDLLRATDDHAIPAVIALLEAHIHALRLLQRTIRVLVPPDSSDRRSTDRPAFRQARRSLASQLDDLLADLEGATASTESSRFDPLIEEARSIRTELSDLSEPTRNIDADKTDEPADADRDAGSSTDGDDTDIDIDAELRSIKSDLSESNEEPDADADEEDEEDDPDGTRD